MIEVKGLKKSIRNGTRVVEILRGIDLLIPKGQFAAIMGASGSGKSTLLGLLAGLDSPSEGEVILDGISIGSLEEDKLAEVRGQRIGFVFQSYQLIPTLTALENVMLPYELNARGDARKKAEPLLAAVGLQDRLQTIMRMSIAADAAMHSVHGERICARHIGTDTRIERVIKPDGAGAIGPDAGDMHPTVLAGRWHSKFAHTITGTVQ